jgi:hypothetical protein
MAPTPTQDNNSLVATPTTTAKPDVKYWTKANIAVTAVFALLFLAIFLLLLAFCLHRRAQVKKREHPASDKSGLLQHKDNTNMFSHGRNSSVTLYVDTETDKQASMELIPLQVTPLDEVHDPINNTASIGSTISRLSINTTSTLLLSPISPNAEEGDLGLRPPGRPRSTSTASQRARYYESAPADVELHPIPKIVHTPVD